MKESEELTPVDRIDICACLMSFHHQPEGIDRSNPKKLFFWFQLNDETRKIINEYLSGDLFINAQDYVYALDNVKRIIHNQNLVI